MAYIQERPRKSGEITYQVRWREGGGRAGTDEGERFGDLESAERFKLLVDAHD